MPTLSPPRITLAEQRGENAIPRTVVALVHAHNDHEKRLQARAGELAGVVADVETLDAGLDGAEADIAALEARLSTAGSIFSMLGPAGAAAPIVAYDFTRFDPSLTSAQNITAANLSGDSSLDLTVTGSAVETYLTKSSDAQGSPHAFRPIGMHSGGGALFVGGGSDYVKTSGAAALRLAGELTVEWMGFVTVPPTVGDVYLYFFDGSGETLATNQLYGLAWFNTGDVWTYIHEEGAGVDSFASLFVSDVSRFNEMRLVPQLLTLTRSSLGLVKFYVNGGLAAASATASPSALPSGGSTADLTLGYGGDAAVRMAVLGFRIFGAELTAAQAQESYRRTFFGVGAT